MIKTGGNIETDIYNLIAAKLKRIISGDVYKSDGREKNATTEDAVIIFTGGLDGQVQEGIVTVNIYIPDIDAGSKGAKVKDTKRCREIEAALLTAIDETTTTEYELTRKTIIQTFAVDEINQHFVNGKIQFKRVTT